MKSSENPMRKNIQYIINAQPGITRRQLGKKLNHLNCKALTACIYRMVTEGEITRVKHGHHDFDLYPIGSEPKDDEDANKVVKIRPALPQDFDLPRFGCPMAWSMAHLLGA